MSEIITGDCFDELEALEANSVEAIVTDPPYGLAFMGKSWDDFEPKEYQEWCEKWAKETLRVLKPGGHMLAFSGNRTHHRLFSGVQDAGFEIRDTITWHHGEGFPKALNVGKETGVEAWDGFQTALKPGSEFCVLARKPIAEDTVSDNVLKYGTGALNIAETRIGTAEDIETPWGERKNPEDATSYSMHSEGERKGLDKEWEPDDGRHPANVVFDTLVAEALDEEVGDLHESTESTRGGTSFDTLYEGGDVGDTEGKSIAFGDSGGPSRYFYTSKATKAERTLNGKINNQHPTVKPVDLMEWLVTLVTAENQTVLDPFAGSGTTGVACKNKNREFIGIEKDAEYADIARARVGLEPEHPDTLRESENQQGLEQYE